MKRSDSFMRMSLPETVKEQAKVGALQSKVQKHLRSQPQLTTMSIKNHNGGEVSTTFSVKLKMWRVRTESGEEESVYCDLHSLSTSIKANRRLNVIWSQNSFCVIVGVFIPLSLWWWKWWWLCFMITCNLCLHICVCVSLVVYLKS